MYFSLNTTKQIPAWVFLSLLIILLIKAIFSQISLKGIVQYLGKYAYLLSY